MGTAGRHEQLVDALDALTADVAADRELPTEVEDAVRNLVMAVMANTVGVAELVGWLGVSRTHAGRIARGRDFVTPLLRHSRLDLWWKRDVTRWLADHRPGQRDR